MGLYYYIDEKTNEIVFTRSGDFGKNSKEIGRLNNNNVKIMPDGKLLIQEGNENYYFENTQEMIYIPEDRLNNSLGDSMDVLSNDKRVLQDNIYIRVNEENIIMYNKDGKKIVAGSLENYKTTLDKNGTLIITENKTGKVWFLENANRPYHEIIEQKNSGNEVNVVSIANDNSMIIDTDTKDGKTKSSFIQLGEKGDGSKTWASVYDTEGKLIKICYTNKELQQAVEKNLKGYDINIHYEDPRGNKKLTQYLDVFTATGGYTSKK
jgi:hypothetical protein